MKIHDFSLKIDQILWKINDQSLDRDLQVSRFAAMSKFARAALTLFARNVPDEEVSLA